MAMPKTNWITILKGMSFMTFEECGVICELLKSQLLDAYVLKMLVYKIQPVELNGLYYVAVFVGIDDAIDLDADKLASLIGLTLEELAPECKYDPTTELVVLPHTGNTEYFGD